MKRILVVFGTRPEAIKLFPVIHALEREEGLSIRTCFTGQHRELAEPVHRFAGIAPNHDLDLMQPGEALSQSFGRMVAALGPVIASERPDWVVVQGDTLSAKAAAMAAHLEEVRVAHVEAGLRTGDLRAPWPEEGNRRIIGAVADLHFAPTEAAAAALQGGSGVHVTGNTVIDALYWAKQRIEDEKASPNGGKRLILVTAHRRESFGAGMVGIAEALERIAARSDVAIAFPRHANPAARQPMDRLEGIANISLLDPLGYPEFVRLLCRAELVLTDSGGLQEEAPALGKPVLVMRDVTERPEGIAAGTARLVGTDPGRIVSAVSELLDDPAAYARMARAHNPYGDGKAAQRIAAILRDVV